MPLQLRRVALNWQRLDDEVVVLDLADSQYLRLNGSGAVLWERLAAGGATLESLTATLVGAYEIREELAREDVRDFVAELRARELLFDEAS